MKPTMADLVQSGRELLAGLILGQTKPPVYAHYDTDHRIPDNNQMGMRDGRIFCRSCGLDWPMRQRYALWPLSFGKTSKIMLRHYGHLGLTRHAWHTGWDCVEQPVDGWTLTLGPFQVYFGNRRPKSTRR